MSMPNHLLRSSMPKRVWCRACSLHDRATPGAAVLLAGGCPLLLFLPLSLLPPVSVTAQRTTPHLWPRLPSTAAMEEGTFIPPGDDETLYCVICEMWLRGEQQAVPHRRRHLHRRNLRQYKRNVVEFHIQRVSQTAWFPQARESPNVFR